MCEKVGLDDTKTSPTHLKQEENKGNFCKYLIKRNGTSLAVLTNF